MHNICAVVKPKLIILMSVNVTVMIREATPLEYKSVSSSSKKDAALMVDEPFVCACVRLARSGPNVH